MVGVNRSDTVCKGEPRDLIGAALLSPLPPMLLEMAYSVQTTSFYGKGSAWQGP